MKNSFLSIVVVIIFGLLLIKVVGYAGELDNTYELNCEVTSISNGEIVFSDHDGKFWVFDNNVDKIKNVHEGDIIEVRFHTNFTPHGRQDDFIRWIKVNKVKYKEVH